MSADKKNSSSWPKSLMPSRSLEVRTEDGKGQANSSMKDSTKASENSGEKPTCAVSCHRCLGYRYLPLIVATSAAVVAMLSIGISLGLTKGENGKPITHPYPFHYASVSVYLAFQRIPSTILMMISGVLIWLAVFIRHPIYYGPHGEEKMQILNLIAVIIMAIACFIGMWGFSICANQVNEPLHVIFEIIFFLATILYEVIFTVCLVVDCIRGECNPNHWSSPKKTKPVMWVSAGICVLMNILLTVFYGIFRTNERPETTIYEWLSVLTLILYIPLGLGLTGLVQDRASDKEGENQPLIA